MSRRTSWMKWVAAGWSLFAGVSAGAIVTNQVTTPAVRATTWSGVGAITFSPVSDPGHGTYLPGSLTGTLLDSTHVLTAAHGVYDGETKSTIDPSHLTFTVGGKALRAASIVIPDQYNGRDNQYDLAIITLTAPATGVETYAWDSGQVAIRGKAFTVVGYGQTGTTAGASPKSKFGTKRLATNVIDLVTRGHKGTALTDRVSSAVSHNNHVVLPSGMLAFDFDRVRGGSGPLGGAAPAVTEGDGGIGDSGSPIFVFDRHHHPVIAGVMLDGSDANVRAGEIAWAADLSNAPYADFIADHVPEPTGAIGLLPTAWLLLRRRKPAR